MDAESEGTRREQAEASGVFNTRWYRGRIMERRKDIAQEGIATRAGPQTRMAPQTLMRLWKNPLAAIEVAKLHSLLGPPGCYVEAQYAAWVLGPVDLAADVPLANRFRPLVTTAIVRDTEHKMCMQISLRVTGPNVEIVKKLGPQAAFCHLEHELTLRVPTFEAAILQAYAVAYLSMTQLEEAPLDMVAKLWPKVDPASGDHDETALHEMGMYLWKFNGMMNW